MSSENSCSPWQYDDRVIITGPALPHGQIEGAVADVGERPAPWLALSGANGVIRIVFLGPGIVVEEAPPRHPGLGPE